MNFQSKKKNPLELPPSYGELPEPKLENKSNENVEATIDKNIEELIENVSGDKNLELNSKDKSAEEFVLEKIKKN